MNSNIKTEDKIFYSNIDPLLKNLSSNSEHLREESAYELRHAGGIRVVEALINSLNDESPRVKAAAADSLSFMNFKYKKEISEAYVKLLDDDSDMVKLAAAKGLGKMNNQEAIEKLIQLLDSDNKQIRLYSAMALGRSGSIHAMAPLAKLCLKEKDRKVRATILIALGNVGNIKVVPLLIKSGLNDLDRRVRASAIESLANFEYSDENRFKIIEIIREKLRTDSDNRVMANSILTLYKLGDLEAISHLSKMIKSSNKWSRASAAYISGYFKENEVIDYLLSLVNDKEPEVRINVVRSLGKIGNSRVIEYLIKFLDDEDDLVKREAYMVFQKIKNPKSIGIANKLLHDKNDVIRYLGLSIVRNIMPQSSLIHLFDARLKEKNKEIKNVMSNVINVISNRYPSELLKIYELNKPKEIEKEILSIAENLDIASKKKIFQKALTSKYQEIKLIAEKKLKDVE